MQHGVTVLLEDEHGQIEQQTRCCDYVSAACRAADPKKKPTSRVGFFFR